MAKKFKVDDIVRGIKGNGHSITNEHMIKGKVVSTYKDQVGVYKMKVRVLEHINPWLVDDIEYTVDNSTSKFELVKKVPEVIVIYRKDNKVIAHNKATDEKAEAKCSLEDKFDFNVGAKLAFSRLMCELEPEDTWYNGKVVCVDNDLNKTLYTVGKIYEFKDGYMIADNGYSKPYRAVKSFKDFMTITASKFIEVVE